ncbi:hypothetical protein HMPREF9440_00304 [Sutterella parvirubra YIT 11816]|uniref:Uncharacterized protein n=1 Tax=Sutterella parvirubra YIT 11816 TaxID=762967 RepID=H3KC55_9BURK|nr:hypothetical protein HMPREF9440_00304 [Sutterella parvirubra YIT 11816]
MIHDLLLLCRSFSDPSADDACRRLFVTARTEPLLTDRRRAVRVNPSEGS